LVDKARNQEKAHSMIYRLREAQTVELGLGTRGDSRPRMASWQRVQDLSVRVRKVEELL
ncbi:hypothetical protein K438DRAFT_1871923, partial [Mycena galopus ATCC 62051]